MSTLATPVTDPRQSPVAAFDVPLRPLHGGRNALEGLGACTCGARVPLQVRLGLRSRTRPVFESRWSCGAACLEARIAFAVRRETKREPVRRQHEHRIPLGLLLLSNGLITQEALRRALELQRGTGERIGEILTRECGVPERKVAAALATQWGCPMWEVSGSLDRMSAVAPAAVLKRGGILPLRLFREGRSDEAVLPRESRLAVAFAHAIDPQVVFALRWMHDVAVDAGVAPVSQWAKGQERMLQAQGVAAEEVDCSSTLDMQQTIVRTLRRLQPVESRWARVHDVYWLRLWLEPAALLGGPHQTEDVVDFIYRLPEASMVGESAQHDAHSYRA